MLFGLACVCDVVHARKVLPWAELNMQSDTSCHLKEGFWCDIEGEGPSKMKSGRSEKHALFQAAASAAVKDEMRKAWAALREGEDLSDDKNEDEVIEAQPK